jgi:NAD(P)-dependent dehydrogenase (short-subunit alcohol dehydrogenase family)
MPHANQRERSAVVFGVGPPRGLGAAIARRFARENFRLTILGRSAEKIAESAGELNASGASVTPIVGDVTDEALVHSVIEAADLPGAPLEVAIFNAGGNWPSGLLDMDASFFENMWRVNGLAGLFFAQAAIKTMLPRKRGVVLFTGASASLRGRARFAAFAAAKAALRAVVQSAAREFGPEGIHLAHIIVDGAIDGDRINTFMPTLKEARGPDGLLNPDAIADNYWHLYLQPRSAWTHELDLRPWTESW